jgi:hypothetical protein
MAPSQTLVTTPALVASGAAQVSVGSDESGVYDAVCVRTGATGTVQCWGASQGGTQFPAPVTQGCATNGGDPNCTPNITTVPTVFSPNNGVAVTAGALAMGLITGAALQGQSVVVWGSDNYGQSGLGLTHSPYPNHFDPRTLSVTGVTAISSAALTTLLLDSGGHVWALGWSDLGQIGNGVFMNGDCPINNGQQCADTPIMLSSPTGVAKVRSGLFGSAAITQDGKLWMWGANYDASLGHAPGTSGDVLCSPGDTAYCNPTPGKVTIGP